MGIPNQNHVADPYKMPDFFQNTYIQILANMCVDKQFDIPQYVTYPTVAPDGSLLYTSKVSIGNFPHWKKKYGSARAFSSVMAAQESAARKALDDIKFHSNSTNKSISKEVPEMCRPYNLGVGQRAMHSFEHTDQRTLRSDNEVLAERAVNQSFSAPVPNVYGPCTLDVGQNVNPNLENEVFPRQRNFQNDEVPNATAINQSFSAPVPNVYGPCTLDVGQNMNPNLENEVFPRQGNFQNDDVPIATAINQSFSAPFPNVYGPCTLDVGQNVNPNLENEIFPRQGNFQNDEVPIATDEPDDNVYNLLAVAANLANVNLQK
ncbi:hypothetical protein CEXT_755791 [Caerostris extrusa]|uniref:DRBM domain-containing protein n=1 Tax=Caerostris extrusa TaxID=172846 RepID=A0AAV4MME4_CAEEX|nr:hypothetical protein CEXT_755791 [Caerostris extrusa]